MMTNINLKIPNDYDAFRKKLVESFPSDFKKDVNRVIDIIPFSKKKYTVTGREVKLVSVSEEEVFLNNENLRIYHRVYFEEPNWISKVLLTKTQKAILNCIYLRHHDGFIRQKCIENLKKSRFYFVLPFSFSLLGEYVIEILTILNKHIDNNRENYYKFYRENVDYTKKIEQRIISYWNEYYRQQFPNINKYIGKTIINKIKQDK